MHIIRGGWKSTHWQSFEYSTAIANSKILPADKPLSPYGVYYITHMVYQYGSGHIAMQFCYFISLFLLLKTIPTTKMKEKHFHMYNRLLSILYQLLHTEWPDQDVQKHCYG